MTLAPGLDVPAPVEVEASRADLRSRLSAIDQGILIGIITLGLIVFGAIFVDGMLTVSNFQTMVRLSSALGILAVGSAVVIMGKNVDLSVAAVVAISAQATVHLWARSGYGEIKAIAIVLAIAMAAGLLNGFLVAYVEIPSLFVTLGTWKLLEGLFKVTLLDAQVYRLPTDSNIVSALGRGEFLGIDAPILIAAVVFGGAWAFMRYTSYGRLIRAMGDGPAAARLTGVPVRPLTVATFVIAALLAALAGLILLGVNDGYSTVYGGSDQLLFNAITAAVIGGVSLTGGKGSIFGVLAGTAFISVFVNLMTLANVSLVTSTAIRGVVLLAALAFDAWLHPRDEETAKSDDL